MKIKEKNIKNLMTYGLDVVLAQKLVDNNLTISKVRVLSKQDLLNLEFSTVETNNIKEKVERQPIDETTLKRLIEDTELHCCICQDIFSKSPVIIHHLEEYAKSQDNSYNNLIVLCLNHHGDVHTTRHISQQDYPKEKLIDLKNKFVSALIEYRAGKRVAPGLEKHIQDNERNLGPREILYKKINLLVSDYIWFWRELYGSSVPKLEPKTIEEFFSHDYISLIWYYLDLNAHPNNPDNLKKIPRYMLGYVFTGNYWEYIPNRFNKFNKTILEIVSRFGKYIEPEIDEKLNNILNSNGKCNFWRDKNKYFSKQRGDCSPSLP